MHKFIKIATMKLLIMEKYEKCEDIKWVTKNSYDHE
jgi:hypothetical protein